MFVVWSNVIELIVAQQRTPECFGQGDLLLQVPMTEVFWLIITFAVLR